MPKITKIYDTTFKAGTVDDDHLYQHMRELNEYMSKPLDENGDEDELSYESVLHKKIRIVVYLDA